MLLQFRLVSNLWETNRPSASINVGVELSLSLSHTPFGVYTPHYPLLYFYFLVVFGASEAIKEGLVPWKKERNLGMNIMRFSSKVLLSFLL
jgi:hypothetical protein